MNLFVADPEWGWWIVLYFFLGGIAAGAYFMATLIELVGTERDRRLSRIGYRVAFPLVLVCGLLLIADLNQPGRFWHMLLKSEVVQEAVDDGWPWSGRGWRLMGQAPLLKYWSPMSVGSWAMLLFGLSSFLALLGSLWPEGLLAGLFRRSFLGKGLAVLGTVVGFFAASYTGALLTATNQPLWSDSVWIAPLFLTSAASTGIATLMLLSRVRAPEDTVTLERLGKADRWALGLEAIVVVVLLVSLGPFLAFVLRTWQGWLFLAGTVLLGLLAPLVIHLRVGIIKRRGAVAASVCALAGGFLLRYGVLAVPPELLARGPSPGVPTPSGPSVWVSGFGPEDGRPPGAAGADAGNRPRALQPRSKVFDEEAP